jgi:hypothetical protein
MFSEPSLLVHVYVRRALVEARAPVPEILADVNAKVLEHGAILLPNRQFLRQPIEETWDIIEHFDRWHAGAAECSRILWADDQRRYFEYLWGLTNPFQFADDDRYGAFAVSARCPAPTLVSDETILALVDTRPPDVPIDCECHFPQLVYTSRLRVVCMSCGHMYCVLADPLKIDDPTSISEAKWRAGFDAEGELIDEAIDPPFVDFREIERARRIWETGFWDGALSRLNFYATASEEQISRFHRTCYPTPEALLALGWEPMPQPPSLTAQLRDDAAGFDLDGNAARSIDKAASAFRDAKTDPAALRGCVLSGFHAVELLLKIKLQEVDPQALAQNPNNPAVIARLSASGVAMNDDETAAITQLRQLRNKLQHAGATYGYRKTRGLLRRVFAFIDRFASAELNIWIGEICQPSGWQELLEINSVRVNAEAIVARQLAQLEPAEHLRIAPCPACERETLVEHYRTSLCLFCRTRPLPSVPDVSDDDLEEVLSWARRD